MSKLLKPKRLAKRAAVTIVSLQTLTTYFPAHSLALPPAKATTVAYVPMPRTSPIPTSAQSQQTQQTFVRSQQTFVRSKVMTRVAARLSGIASWYGRALHGHKTASGEIFDETALTACHRTLPFGTKVRVENLRNHETVVVRITDRGVLNAERVIDLSSAAAEKIGMLRDGVAPVRLTIIRD